MQSLLGVPAQLVARLALQKAEDVARRVDRGLVIGCDTVAECAADSRQTGDCYDALAMLGR